MLETVEEKGNKIKLSSFIVKYVSRKVNSQLFEEFLKSINFHYSGDKGTKMYRMEKDLNAIEDQTELIEKQEQIALFFSQQIKYYRNRLIISYPFRITADSGVYSVQNLENYTNLSIKDLNFSNMFLESFELNSNFKKVDQLIKVNNKDRLELIEIIYAREVKPFDSVSKLKAEFVYIEVDFVTEEVKIHIENNGRNYLTDLQGKPGSIYKYFQNELLRQFGIQRDIEPENQTLFKMYRELTSYAEKSYIQDSNCIDSKIEDFKDKIFKELKLSQKDDLIKISNRIKNLFVRIMIQKDFDNFIGIQKKGIGRVKSLVFRDDDGGSIFANSGTTNDAGYDEIDLEKHKVYFDTKDSIYEAQELFQILIIWNLQSARVKVRYTAYDEFLLTHFLKEPVSKEVYEDVFPKFRGFKKIPL